MTRHASDQMTADAVPGRLVLLLALACGVSVATNYYAQALLAQIADDLRVSGAMTASLVTLAQVGVAIGIVLLVPLGDLMDRRRLVPVLLGLASLALTAEAAAPNFPLLAAGALLASVFAATGQVIVPLAATLAPGHSRGKVIGQVMSGLLLGILLARTVAGLLASVGGWRLVYLVAAVLVASLAVVLRRALPPTRPSSTLRYGRLLVSVLSLVRSHPTLRIRALYGLLTFAAFGAFWTCLALLLAGPPYHYGEAAIGLLSLFGAGGALAARSAGRMVDRGWLHPETGGFLLVGLAGWAIAVAGGRQLLAVIVGMVLIDLAVQGTHIANQTAIYRLDPAARGRVTTAYMSAYFLGGGLGSAFAALAYQHAGWPGVCLVGGGSLLLGLLVWLVEQLCRGTLRDDSAPHTPRLLHRKR